MVEKLRVVAKGSKEFEEAKNQYLKLFFDTKPEKLIPKGVYEFGPHQGKCLGFTSKKILDAKLPMPFGCPDLFIQPIPKEGEGLYIVWFCDRAGCLCSPCREDMTEEWESYPKYCPPEYCLDTYGEEEEEW